jgi:hypothetical protein
VLPWFRTPTDWRKHENLDNDLLLPIELARKKLLQKVPVEIREILADGRGAVFGNGYTVTRGL